jgi:hypothetical protein
MDVQKGITGWESDVGNQIKSGTPTMDQGAANTMASGGGIDPYYKTSYQGGKDAAPTQVGKVVAPTVSYAGPTDPTATKGYGDIKKSSQDLTDKANRLGEWSGIQGYLKGTVKGPYTQGMSNYDTLLAKTSGGDLMGRTKAKYNQTGKQLDTAASNLSTAAKNAGYQANAVQGQWNDYTAKINADAKAATDKAAQEGALKNMNAGIAQQWILPGTEKPLEDLTKINQDIAAKNNESAFYAQQKAATDAAAAAAKRQEDEQKKKRSTLHDPIKATGGAISGGFKKLRSKF